MRLKNASEIIEQGGVVAYPTDTAYGLGADPENKKAVLEIFKIKGRKKEKSLPLIASDIKIVKKYAKLDKASLQLAKKYWPGPLTLVLEPTALANKKFSKYVFSYASNSHCCKNLKHKRKIAIRIPDNSVARKLSKSLGRPITSTSANISGQPMCYSKKQVDKQFFSNKYKPDFILDGGRLKKSKPSTIIEVQNGKIVILRQGEIGI